MRGPTFIGPFSPKKTGGAQSTFYLNLAKNWGGRALPVHRKTTPLVFTYHGEQSKPPFWQFMIEKMVALRCPKGPQTPKHTLELLEGTSVKSQLHTTVRLVMIIETKEKTCP